MTEAEEVDLIMPPGTPRTIIRDIALNFEVDMVSVTRPLNYANMVNDERELIAFRGRPEEIKKAEAFLLEKLREFIDN
ncbi:MAG: hypothetical protein O0X93_09210 [Methanocorpusculum sp.]|uniref:Uncharacterized protein n=1 Tax=Methanocorpusculum petauri TaxID=3002863 RepID=A0ABT4II48_9EURY|nr:hypothetical protein [Methanocorpusculum petauri]MCZ9312461.1 hypothetical protein [Methanocorpusculum sp.]MCZ0861413.1 hypothetical protein [Methanocorpusculum petauri]MDE2444167.1 hypothetical protein [Methanocorpusculum sp.]MDE2523315.1 hypothetical protein [Methanocorpusculum sp.]MDE2524968.1 hypothetical protein [Methanocorpusculum sp.]